MGNPIRLFASGGTTYQWTPATGLDNPNIADPMANPSVTTTYTVRISSGVNCFKDVPVTLTVNPKPTADFRTETTDFCSTFPLILIKNTSINANSFVWEFGNGQTSVAAEPSIRYINEGTYNIRLYAYNNGSCVSFTQRTVDIRRNTVLAATIQPFKAICKGDSVQLQVNGGQSYAWSPSIGLSNANIANPMASPAQTTTYTVSILNQFNCRKDTTLTVVVAPAISNDFSVVLSDNCSRFPFVTIKNLATNANNTSYLWDFGNGQTSNLMQPPAFKYDEAGNYVIKLVVSNGVCSRTKIYNLTYQENADYNFFTRITSMPTQKLCAGDTIQLQVAGGQKYYWSPTIGLSNANIANPLAFPKTTTRYTVRISNHLGCYRDTSILVSVAQKIQADFTVALLESCDQEYPLVRISPILSNGEIYQWTFGNDSTYIGEFPPTFRYQKAGTYTIKVKGINQFCEKEFSKTIKINRNDVDFAKKITIMPQKPVICIGATVPLQVTGGVKYLWTPATGLSNPNIANPIAKPLVTTRYSVRISNENGCYVDSTMLIVVAEEVKADFELQISSECGKNGAITFVNKSTGTGEYKWTLGNGVEIREQNPKEYGFEKSGEYEIILEVFNGVCRKTKSQKVKIETVKPANVITPNGDGKNDRFVLDMLEQGWKLEIYDRYGNVKFKTDNYQNEWGGDVESGTYYYLLTSPSGKTCKGWIQVLKGE